ncbi:MAG TPA: DUF927 domain-containing protein [Hyphomicrobiaceae bacterium]|nr:DUF927 domain-containing protein [Hyphomicrobiaceae bacterium]
MGKTTLIQVGGSVWGGGGLTGYIRSWRATDNGLESVAMAHCDTLLALDGLAEIEATAAGKAAYMLANGHAKQRMTRTAGVRPAPEWRLLFLSTGEIGLADKVGEDPRKRIAAGQECQSASKIDPLSASNFDPLTMTTSAAGAGAVERSGTA